jgi:hypothetical protein
MFERFTDRARRVVAGAQEEARSLNQNWIGTEHLLLALLTEGQGLAAKALEAMQISLDTVRQQVEASIGHGQSHPSGHIPFTPSAKKVLELSLREALQMGHNYIGTEHILLGLVREGGVAAQVLTGLGVDLNRTRQQVLQLLHGHQAEEPAEVLGHELRDRLTAVAARLAAIERRLGEGERLAAGGSDGAQQTVVAALPEGADLGEAGLGQRLDVGGELRRFAVVVAGFDAAVGAFGHLRGQYRVGGGLLPPGVPAHRVPAGKAPLVLAPPQGQVQAGQRG